MSRADEYLYRVGAGGSTKRKPDDIIQHNGDTWKIISLGTRENGKVYAHLASTTRGQQQRNGWYPVQNCDWIDDEGAA